MKKNISNKEILERARKWLSSISNEDLIKKIEEEHRCAERDRAECFTWLTSTNPGIHDSLPEEIKSNPKPKEDEREFKWSLHPILNPVDEKYNIPTPSAPNHEAFFLEAA